MFLLMNPDRNHKIYHSPFNLLFSTASTRGEQIPYRLRRVLLESSFTVENGGVENGK